MSTKVRRAKAQAEHDDGRGELSPEAIAVRAYELHLSGSGGDALEDWLRAEEELSAELRAGLVLAAEQEPGEEMHAAA
jgi:hypothetical protein